jgi:hypothetical protein
MPYIAIVNDSDLSVFPTTMQALHEGMKKGTGDVNRKAIGIVSVYAERNFANSIQRDATSATVGGETYREGSRVTGRFTFGKGKTFTGSLLKNLGPNVTGFGYPIVNRADTITKRVWRGLEFGWDSMRMPLGIWRDVNGNRVRSSENARLLGGDQFFPGGGGGQEVRGIAAKQFITIAFEDTVANYVEPGYRRVAEEIASKVSRGVK